MLQLFPIVLDMFENVNVDYGVESLARIQAPQGAGYGFVSTPDGGLRKVLG